MAIKVDAWLQDEDIRKDFCARVRQWQDDRDSREKPDPHDSGYITDAVEILPKRSATLNEKTTTLLCIRNMRCEGVARIDPFSRPVCDPDEGTMSWSPGGIAFAVLGAGVSRLQNSDRRRIEGYLADVEHELARRFPDSSDKEPSVGHPSIDQTDLYILNAMRNSKTRLTLDNIETGARVSRRTAVSRTNSLIEAGLVERPKGKRGGAGLTEAGRRRVESP